MLLQHFAIALLLTYIIIFLQSIFLVYYYISKSRKGKFYKKIKKITIKKMNWSLLVNILFTFLILLSAFLFDLLASEETKQSLFKFLGAKLWTGGVLALSVVISTTTVLLFLIKWRMKKVIIPEEVSSKK
ncbi:hypothetical protein [Mycoplasma crocodyli]|uniref:hypothetical protein n=1 Tax=Mycoplasma crocodyli TaxID=50052 RepID=UPI0005A27E90|nr:hypothetical protein [Mycoplasma crocodyli]